jgi:hypothetical protein
MISIRGTLIIAVLIGAAGFASFRAVQAQDDLPPLPMTDLAPLPTTRGADPSTQFLNLLSIAQPDVATPTPEVPPESPPLVRPPVSQPLPGNVGLS